MTEANIVQVVTHSGDVYTEGSFNPSGVGDPNARLEGVRREGDDFALDYEGRLQLTIPASQVRFIASGPARVTTANR